MSSSYPPVLKRWPAPVRALAHRNFQIYFAGQAISTLGKWVQQVALSWLAYHLTGSAFLLGLLTFLTLAPQLVVGPLAGAWIDRHDKRRLLIIAQALLAGQSLTLAILAWLGWIDDTIIIVMAVLLGLLNAVETPLRQALISSFVDEPADLPNALALNAMLINAARFIGPPLAGFLITVSGEGACFFMTSIAFGLLLVSLIRTRVAAEVKASGSTGQVFKEGLSYIWRTTDIRRLMIGVVVVNLLASNYAVLLPILAKSIYGGDAQTLGWLWGAAGVGAFVSTLMLALGGTLNRLGAFITAAVLCCSVAMLGMALNVPLAAALGLLALVGFGITASNVSTNMLLQSKAPAALRGRVVAFYIAMRFGFEAIGGLLAGLGAAFMGAPATLGVTGALLLVFFTADRYWAAKP
ncbi:MFS transporter [Pseudomonas ficuserectae]|uniref:Transporter-like membrane protein n=1 Tax=Pseudomonas amygdali pv. lachrymans TaxID=53707 RepID=A0AB37R8A8_PSEAV|nr:MFS transporter [Pseudomonas amygdali]KKY54540.1 transporter [Pseudomonas amygdali pv. lachrymans]KPC00146.1 putative transporter-like membrane protein [Pseudomonas amygdali pv. lachrymans]RMM52121.1 putative transporter-like membrane protein [Pseudomonas amygdali pv. lachrymans]RMU21475.1 putative transporter-like membrane protein [Pseudomonas amygdali pv. lachrymans]WIO56789.1 MFS transporter [Pseudomonas amygdali pv. lachrymans]